MHCAACEGRVAAAINSIPGVTGVHVSRAGSKDAAGPHATVHSDREIALDTLRHAVRSAGGAGSSYDVIGPAATPASAGTAADGEPANESLYPLVLIVSFIVGVVAIVGLRRPAWSWHESMLDFMAGFFVVFSFFKLLDLRGFVSAYRMYDLVAARSWGGAYALAYPFLELALGVAYLTRFHLVVTNVVTLVVMVVGTIGVARAVLSQRRIRCACLGTALNLPMTTVTIVEDVGMALMAAAMLLWPVLA